MSQLATGIHGPVCPDGRQAQAPEACRPCAEASRPFVLAATIVASAMAFIDGSVMTIALPALQLDLNASFASLQWVVNAYALLLGGLILVGGAAGDRFGRRRIFVIGIAVFAGASMLCALAPTIASLIAARALQGIGGALLVPQGLAIIAASFPKEIRGRAIGVWAGAAAITTALGPPLGGLLVDAFGWRSIFYINLPMSAGAIWLTLTHVPESRDEDANGALDWRGAVLAIAGLGLVTIGLTQLAEGTANLAAALGLMLTGAVVLTLFVRTERNARNPLVPLSLFSDRAFTGANVTTVLLYGALGGVLFLLPFDLIARRGVTATGVGLTLLPFGLIIGVGSRLAGGWADRHGARLPLIVGSALVGLAGIVLAAGMANYWLGVLAPVLLMAVGMAIVVAPLTTAVMNAAPDNQSGAASGISNAASRLAGLFAVAIVGATASAVFVASLDPSEGGLGSARFGALPSADDPARSVLETAFDQAYTVAMSLAAAGGVLAALATAWLQPGDKQAA